MSLEFILWAAFVLVFCGFPAALLLADRYGDRVHAWLARFWRKARREIACRLLAPDGLTVRPMRETETALCALPPVTTSADELLEIIGRWSA